MRIVRESNGKRYRAYSPTEFFTSPEGPHTPLDLNQFKPKRVFEKPSDTKTHL